MLKFLIFLFVGALVGIIVFFIPYSIGRRDQRDEYKVTMDTNNIDYITIDLDDNTNIIIKNCKFYDNPNYDVEDMIDAETEKMLSKHYYAMIITKEHPMWREPKDKYQVLLMDTPNRNEFDPNINSWLLINRFTFCKDIESVMYAMELMPEWDKEPIWPKLKWSWTP